MPAPLFAPERERTKEQPWKRDPQSRVIQMPMSATSSVARKRGARQLSEIAQPISSNSVDLLPETKTRIARLWARGIQTAHIAKMYRLTIAQAEAVIWEAYNRPPGPSDEQPTVRESRTLHVIGRAA